MKGKINDLSKELINIEKDKGIYLFLFESGDYPGVRSKIIMHMTNKLKLSGIYLSLNIGYPQIKDRLERDSIDTSKLHFIDCVGKKIGSTIISKECSLIRNPASLTELSIVLTETVNKNKGKFKFLFLDSLNTLLLSNENKTVESFMHYLTNKLRYMDIAGIVLAVHGEEVKKLLSSISQFCDRCIYLKNGKWENY